MTHHPQVNEREAAFQQESWRHAESPGGFVELLDQLCEHGFEGMARVMQALSNEAMKLERSAVLGARPGQSHSSRLVARAGLQLPASDRAASVKNLASPLGPLTTRIPQTFRTKPNTR